MKTGIIGILNNPATSLNSHSAGMVNIVCKLFDAQVETDYNRWNEYDRLIIYHGVNFKEGQFNIMGGINQEIINRCDCLLRVNNLYSLDGFQLNDFSKKRKLSFTEVDNIKSITLPEKENLVIGDSHSISVWPDESYSISRNDGKTLHGFLKLNIDLSIYKHVIMYFGNIDLRFHLCRQEDPEKSTIDLFSRYIDYARQYNSTLVHLLPIEDESRKLPNSGKYKGKTFFGSIDERKKLRKLANNIISDSGLDFMSWPDSFLDDKCNLRFDIMEPNKSVHIRPLYYMNHVKKQLTLF